MKIAPWNPSEIYWALIAHLCKDQCTAIHRACVLLLWLLLCSSTLAAMLPLCVVLYRYRWLCSLFLKKKKSLMLQNRALFKCLMSFFSSLCVTSSSACPKDTNAITVALQSPGKPLFTVQEVC